MKTIKTTGRRNEWMAATVGLAAISIAVQAPRVAAHDSAVTARQEKGVVTVQSKFYCNIKALTPAERVRHHELTEKVIGVRKDVVEMDKGYEFQYSPAEVSLAELAEWVVAEAKCCPFFDFHIDLEREGALLCLRLTGEEGIKAFTRAEFPLARK